MLETLRQFKEVLFEEDDLIEIRTLWNERGTKNHPQSYWVFAEDLEDSIAPINKRNKKGYGVFVGVLPRIEKGNTNDDEVTSSSILWVDFDHISNREAKKKIKSSPMPQPTMLVNSGNGLHAYWKLSEKQPPSVLAKMVHDMSHLLESDTSVCNPSRILRLPPFINTKIPNKETGILQIHHDNVYSFDELRSLVPEIEQEKAIREEFIGKVDVTTSKYEKCLKMAKSYIEKMDNAGEGGRAVQAMTVACRCWDFGLDIEDAKELLSEWNNNNTPPLCDSELVHQLESAWKYAKSEHGNKVTDVTDDEQEEGFDKRKRSKERKKKTKNKKEPIATDYTDVLFNEFESMIDGSRAHAPLDIGGMFDVPLFGPGIFSVITGEPGVSKSFLALKAGIKLSEHNIDWTYLPLENDKLYHTRRLLSVAKGNWEFCSTTLDRTPNQLKHTQRKIQAESELIKTLHNHIDDNPGVGVDAQIITPDFILNKIEDYIDDGKRVIFIDPIASISWSGKDKWRDQENFINELQKLVAASDVTACLVIHQAKRVEEGGVYSVEGSKRFSDLAQCIIRVHSKGKKDWQSLDKSPIDEFNRIITIDKARDTPAQGKSFAFHLGNTGPTWDFKGIVKST